MSTTKQPPAATVGHPFPDLPKINHPMFWVFALLRDQAMLDEFSKKARKFFGDKNLVLSLSMIKAENFLLEDVHKSAKEAQKNGVLLFCHKATTALNGGAS